MGGVALCDGVLAPRVGSARVVDDAGTLEGMLLRRAVDALALALAGAGAGSGEVLGLALAPARALVPAALASWRLGASVLLVPPGLGSAELAAVAAGLRPRLLVATASDASRLAAALGAVAEPLAVDGLPPLVLLRPRVAAGEGFPEGGLVKLSSGSTGQPKAVMLDAGNVAAEAVALASSLGLCEGDRVVAPVPLTHSYGFDLGVLATLAAGATLEQRPVRSPRRAAADMTEATVYLGVPALYRTLAEAPLAAPPALDGARFLLSCTAPLSEALVERFAARFGAPLCQHYGSSETGGVATHVPPPWPGGPGRSAAPCPEWRCTSRPTRASWWWQARPSPAATRSARRMVPRRWPRARSVRATWPRSTVRASSACSGGATR